MFISGNSKVIADCVRLVNNTEVPSVFFSRMDTLLERADLISKLESINPKLFIGSPSAQARTIRNNMASSIDAMINRYWDRTKTAAAKLRTEAARVRKFDAFFSIINQYEHRMYPQNRMLLEKLKRTVT